MNAVEMKGIVKQYPLVRAVDRADFTVRKGEIHSLLGENGAGKSTLMKILYGMTSCQEGEILINGQAAKFKNSSQAMAAGIGMVHQHFMLVPVMTVSENVVIGFEPVKGGFFDKKRADTEVQKMIDEFDFQINAKEKVENLSLGEQQRVEILKAIYHGAQILILDEPTAVLTPQEVHELFKVMKELKAKGKSIIIITHKLKETKEIADRISVLRDGKMVEMGIETKNATIEELANLMVGREVNLSIVRKSEKIEEVSFEIEHAFLKKRGKEVLKDLSLCVHKSEILGIAGIEGNGQTELIEVLTGIQTLDSGVIKKGGIPVKGDVKDFLDQNIGHVPEDRSTRGLVLEFSIKENLILGYHKKEKFQKRGILKGKEISKYAIDNMKNYRIKAPNELTPCQSLSGGNQQKVVIARVFSQDPDVIIVAQPTRGVDVGAQEYIHNALLNLRDEGKAILLISADLDEVRCLSDSLAVMYDGQIVHQSKPEEISETQVGILMTGGTL